MEEEDNHKEITRILVKYGEISVEIEGNHDSVISMMGDPIFTFINNLIDIAYKSEEISEQVSEEESEIDAGVPIIKKQNTLINTLHYLMSETDWGKKPRTLSQIMTALETNGIYYESSTVSKQLLNLIRRGSLRRIGTRGSYKYITS
ncbi:MAG: hypothetical protein ACTSWX_01255 [Promethearchaeota archaeon]